MRPDHPGSEIRCYGCGTRRTSAEISAKEDGEASPCALSTATAS